MKLIKTGIVAAIVMFVAAAPIVAQNLLVETEDYQRAQELRRQAEEAFEDGDYDEAEELVGEAEESLERARAEAQRQRDGFRAANARTLAERRLDEAEGFDISEFYEDELDEAESLFDEGQDLYDDEEYVDSREQFRDVLDVLDDDLIASLRERYREAQEEEEEEEDTPELPEYYEVRRIPDRRDSFWRIAEYEFVYDDPWEWQRLYEANRDMLRDPDNPDLIHPGMEFRIPTLDDEERAGIWRDGEIEER
ncbi:MAG: hypothetical protein ACLFM0_02880 [Spirochaetales bacterium]